MLRLVVVLPLRPLEPTAGFTLRDWPLHLTVAPTFVIDTELPAVVAAIAPRLLVQRRLRLRAGPDEGFGRSMTIPVSVVEPSTELTELHLGLIGDLRGVGAIFDDPDFIGQGYRPHVTKTLGAQLCAGDELLLRQAALVDMEPLGDERLRRIVWAAPFEVRQTEDGLPTTSR